jgi:hypothetical protein
MLSPADCAIQAFGGQRKLASAIRRWPSAVARWRRSGDVPLEARRLILAEAQARGLPLSVEELAVGREVPHAQGTAGHGAAGRR